jgi:hypothetical protein
MQQVNKALEFIMPKIVYVQTAYYQNIDQAIRNALQVKPFVNQCLIITDVDPLPNNESIIFKQHPWTDDFTSYMNHAIDESRSLKADYILFSDPSETFNDMFLAHLAQIVILCPQFNGFEVYCNLNIENASQLDNGTLKREAPGGTSLDSNFWKLLLYKLEPMTKYISSGNSEKCVHFSLKGNWNILKLPKYYFYNDNKSAQDIWSSSARNVFICGGGENVGKDNQFFVDLHNICDSLNIKAYREFTEYCKKGKIDSKLKQLILDHRHDADKYYSSEMRDIFHWYFDYLHPEENEGWRSEYKETSEIILNDFIQKKYFEVLGRHSDGKGRAEYVNRILSSELAVDKVEPEMRQSNEYVHNLINTKAFEMLGRGSSETEQKVWSRLIKAGHISDIGAVFGETKKFLDVTLAYCQMTYKVDLDKTIQNVIDAKPHVDVCVVVYDDSLSSDDVQKLIDAGACAKYHKWLDNFPRQRNNYLKEAKTWGATWTLVSDPDEHLDIKLLKDARELAKQADKVGISLLMINAHDIMTDDEDGNSLSIDQQHENVPDYHKNLFFKLLPDVMYTGIGETQNLHENLQGSFRVWNLDRQYFYRHIKSHVEIWEHSARNIFVSGGGMNAGMQVQAYHELKPLLEKYDFKTWYQWRDYLKQGNINQEFRDFIIRNRNNYGHDYDSEYRELFKYYFMHLHPDENTDHLKVDANDSGIKDQPKPPADDIEEFVDKCYRDILKREADTPGKSNYINQIKAGNMKKDDLIKILQNSDEYKTISQLGLST